jgi:AcrR family transcriptional regulator
LLYSCYNIAMPRVTVERSSRANSGVHTDLTDAAARVIATEGRAALTLRRVADEVGTSTMAVYTNFGGMPGLRRAVRLEWFSRLGAELEALGQTDDPVADLALLGLAYYRKAIASSHLYRASFLDHPLDAADAAAGTEAFASLVRTVERCIAAGRFDETDPRMLATEFWALGHGIIALQLAQLVPVEDAVRALKDAVFRLFRGFGDDPEAAARSMERARNDARLTAINA